MPCQVRLIHSVGLDETLIWALSLAPPSLSISIRIHVTSAPAAMAALPRSYGSKNDGKNTRDDSRSEIVESEDAEAIEKSKDSLLADVVKLVNGRCDLRSVLSDEVESATGRMSVSGQSPSPRAASCHGSNSVF